jgi:hypothetical protein
MFTPFRSLQQLQLLVFGAFGTSDLFLIGCGMDDKSLWLSNWDDSTHDDTKHVTEERAAALGTAAVTTCSRFQSVATAVSKQNCIHEDFTGWSSGNACYHSVQNSVFMFPP